MEAPVPPMDGAPTEGAEGIADAIADIHAVDPSFDPTDMTDGVLASMESEVPDLQGETPVYRQMTAAGMAMGGQVTYVTAMQNMSDDEYAKALYEGAMPKPWHYRPQEVKDLVYEPMTDSKYEQMAKQIDRSNGGGSDFVGAALAIGLVVFVLVVVGGLMAGG